MHTCSLLKVMNSTKFHKDIEVLAQSEHRIRSVRPDIWSIWSYVQTVINL